MRGEEKPYDLLTQGATGEQQEDTSCEGGDTTESMDDLLGTVQVSDSIIGTVQVSDSIIVSKVQTMLTTTAASKPPPPQPSVVPALTMSPSITSTTASGNSLQVTPTVVHQTGPPKIQLIPRQKFKSPFPNSLPVSTAMSTAAALHQLQQPLPVTSNKLQQPTINLQPAPPPTVILPTTPLPPPACTQQSVPASSGQSQALATAARLMPISPGPTIRIGGANGQQTAQLLVAVVQPGHILRPAGPSSLITSPGLVNGLPVHSSGGQTLPVAGTPGRLDSLPSPCSSLASSSPRSHMADTLLSSAAAAAAASNPNPIPLDALLTPAASPEDDSLEPWIQTI